MNPMCGEIKLKMRICHMNKKDEQVDHELHSTFHMISSNSDECGVSHLFNDTDACSSDSDWSVSNLDSTKKSKTRKNRSECYNIVAFEDWRIKAMQRYSSWFTMRVNNPNLDNNTVLKNFRERFRFTCYKYKETLDILKGDPDFAH